MGPPQLYVDRQSEVFAALVAFQDTGATRWDSCELAARQFGVPLAAVPGIEEAGMAGRWWPLTYGTLAELIPPMLDWAERTATGLDSVDVSGEPGVLPG